MHAAALAASDGAGLVAAGERFEELGGSLWAAEAFASAAAALESEGRASSARTSAARAGVVLARRCEGAHTPALSDITLGTLLTPRERDVALLAARGLANREIAERFVVSVRTIESHLAQAYRKLGVKDRTELSGLLADGDGSSARRALYVGGRRAGQWCSTDAVRGRRP